MDISLTVTSEDEGMRADKYLAVKLDNFTRSSLEKLFDYGKILVNNKEKHKNYKLAVGDEITIFVDEKPIESNVKPESLPLEILYEDDHLLVVNKSKGMVVHPSLPEETGTLVNALLYHCGDALSNIGGQLRPGIIHRIDKDTSGLLVVAKDNETHEGLAMQAEEHTMLRIYEGVVHGFIKPDDGVIDAKIARHPVQRTKFCVPVNNAVKARRAVTRYHVLSRFDSFTHMEFALETGRTHQIRVHMADIGHPVAGDDVYGPAKSAKPLDGQCLHARTLGFTHPVTGERLEFTSGLPSYFTEFLNIIAGDAK